MIRELQTNPYPAPSFRMLVARAAQAELKAKGDPQAANVQKMLALIDRQLTIRLAPMLVVGSIPFVVLLLTSEDNNKHYALPDVLSVLGGYWAILALWIMLEKGMDMMSQDTTAWLLLGVGNLFAVVLLFSSLAFFM